MKHNIFERLRQSQITTFCHSGEFSQYLTHHHHTQQLRIYFDQTSWRENWRASLLQTECGGKLLLTESVLMSIKPKFLYGVRGGVTRGLHFSADQTILYPAGSGVARKLSFNISLFYFCYICTFHY